MEHFALLLVIFALLALPTAWLLLRRHRPFEIREELSPISRQHIDLFQGGQLSEGAVESFKARYRDLLERGEVEAIEASLRGGMQYVVQVRALAELGTDDAGRILERQLQRKITDDLIEQSWYWIDLAHGLRSLNRSQSLPHLLHCAEQAAELPLGQFFAAETVCFLGFAGYLRQQDTPLGQSALRVLHRALEGLRFGLQPIVVPEARLGELVENVWDHRAERETEPLAVRVFVEGIRLYRRAVHGEVMLAAEPSELEAFRMQVSRLATLEPALSDYLSEAPASLCRQLADAPVERHHDLLQALIDLRADAAAVVLPLLKQPGHPHLDLALETLLWSRDERVGQALRKWVIDQLPVSRRAQRRRRAWPPRRPSVPEDFPYRAVLRALRAHPGPQTEALLLLSARDWDPTYRAAAVGSLGWWEPGDRGAVVMTLQDARRDLNPEVRQSARAALARLGERQALQWFRQTLTSEDPHQVHEAIQAVALESLTLLYPDLDHLADADDPDVAYHAREALERMCEEMDHRRALGG